MEIGEVKRTRIIHPLTEPIPQKVTEPQPVEAPAVPDRVPVLVPA